MNKHAGNVYHGSPSYTNFGKMVGDLRKQKGFEQQSDLAAVVGTTQQTVSRWEAGLSRPRYGQLSSIANALGVEFDELARAAGYERQSIVTPFDQPLPVEGLGWEQFQRFSHYFLERLYPDANVHPVGGAGHSQEGSDIEVAFRDDTCSSFQCKRVAEFGPEKVRKTVKDYRGKARHKVILLSRIASPRARKAIGEYRSWDIWDKEDISLQFRKLSKDDQRRLIGIFFPGQRLQLLGETEPGVWQTCREFFDPFTDRGSLFNHTWSLVGRTDELKALVDTISGGDQQVVFLVGSGGIGKSRLLKEAITKLESAHPEILVRFAAPVRDGITLKDLEDLGNRAKVLVVDDAQDFDDARILFQHVSVAKKAAKVLLVVRPYVLEYLRQQTRLFGLATDRICEINLKPFPIADAVQLAKEVLRSRGGAESIADEIARLTVDCPLATVVAAEIIATEKIPMALLSNDDGFRNTLFGKFRDTIAGRIGTQGDEDPTKKVMRLIALLQPFNPNDSTFYDVVEKAEAIPASEAVRLTRKLIEASVLFRQRSLYRLSPDLLADYIIRDVCVGPNGLSTGYAERVFDSVSGYQIEHLLSNLGKIDWRINAGDPSTSRLLDGVWGKLRPTTDYDDPHVNAVASVAFYEPLRAIEFVESAIRQGQRYRGLSAILRNAAYNVDFLPRVCECLWELGKDDRRALQQHPDHPLRVLSDLSSLELDKPLAYNELVVDFGISLFRRGDSWNHRHSPFSFLAEALRPEGYQSRSNGNAITFRPFVVTPDSLGKFREKLVDAVIELLADPNVRIAIKAADFLENALRFPSGYFGLVVEEQTTRLWEVEIANTLTKIENKVSSVDLDPLVLLQLQRTVSWHAEFGRSTSKRIATRITDSVPQSIDFKVTRALLGEQTASPVGLSFEERFNVAAAEFASLAKELLSIHGDVGKLRTLLEGRLSAIEGAGLKRTAPSSLMWTLINLSVEFAIEIAERVLEDPKSPTVPFGGAALARVLADNAALGMVIAQRYLEANDTTVQVALAEALRAWFSQDNRHLDETKGLVGRMLESNDERVVLGAYQSILFATRGDARRAIEWMKRINLSMSTSLADSILLVFEPNANVPFSSLDEADIDVILEKLKPLRTLDGYWIDSFLAKCSEHHGVRTARFFRERVELAASQSDWDFRPCNHGPYCHVPLRFRNALDFPAILRETAAWMAAKEGNDLGFHFRARELFSAMFGPIDGEVFNFLVSWLHLAGQSDMLSISHILSEAQPRFVFDHRDFVVEYLEKAAGFGRELLEQAVAGLWSSAIGGVRSGTLGQPFPEDLWMKDEAEKAMASTSRMSQAYELYQGLKKTAEAGIRRSLAEGEALAE